jgi:mannose-6-phosphate isomerase-like protein (cupin superfamily)
MRIVKKEDITKPFLSTTGEIIFEMIGHPKEIGGTEKHSIVYTVIPSGKNSPAHFHTSSEETFYMLKGKGRMVINKKEFFLYPGQACLIMPGEVHQIFNEAVNEDLEFLTISAPTWTPDDSTYV